MVSRAQLGAEGGLQQAATVRDLFLERFFNFLIRSSNCLGIDLEGMTVDCNSSLFGSSILMENVVVGYGNLRICGGLPKPGFRHGKDIRVSRI